MKHGDRNQMGRDGTVRGGNLSDGSQERARPVSDRGQDKECAGGVNWRQDDG